MSIFIAQLFPKDKVKDIKGASQAGINFCHSFIEAINPARVFAYQLNSEQKKLHFDFGDDRIEYVVTRAFPHKGIFKGLNTVIENLRITGKVIRSGQKNIWFYNMTPQVMLIFLILQFLTRKKCFVVVADFTPGIFRNKLALMLLKRSSGIISLTPELRKLIGEKCPVLVKAGIVNNVVQSNDEKGINRKNFLFSGSLGKYTGIDLALVAFSELPDMTLYVSGRGEGEKEVAEFSKRYPNIKHVGFLGYKEYIELLDQVDFVLSLRDTSLGKNLYNFPSKIIEYYIGSKIVISTKRYTTLDDDTYVHCNYNKEELKKSTKQVVSLPEDELRLMKNRANSFARENFSYESWNQAVRSLEQ